MGRVPHHLIRSAVSVRAANQSMGTVNAALHAPQSRLMAGIQVIQGAGWSWDLPAACEAAPLEHQADDRTVPDGGNAPPQHPPWPRA